MRLDTVADELDKEVKVKDASVFKWIRRGILLALALPGVAFLGVDSQAALCNGPCPSDTPGTSTGGSCSVGLTEFLHGLEDLNTRDLVNTQDQGGGVGVFIEREGNRQDGELIIEQGNEEPRRREYPGIDALTGSDHRFTFYFVDERNRRFNINATVAYRRHVSRNSHVMTRNGYCIFEVRAGRSLEFSARSSGAVEWAMVWLDRNRNNWGDVDGVFWPFVVRTCRNANSC